MLLIDLLEIVFIVLMLTLTGSLSSACSLPLLRSLLLCEAALCECRTSLFNLLLLCLLIAMSMGQLTVLPLEDDRLASNASVDVENGRVLGLKVTCAIAHRVLLSIFVREYFLGSLDYIQIVGLLLVAAEVLDLGPETCHKVKLQLPFGLEASS